MTFDVRDSQKEDLRNKLNRLVDSTPIMIKATKEDQISVTRFVKNLFFQSSKGEVGARYL